MTVLLMNPNSNSDTTRAMVTIAQNCLDDVCGWTAPAGPRMITDEAALDAQALEVARADVGQPSGVIVSAFGDPGREALARRLPCPVIGIGAAAARAAAKIGPFAVATTTPGLRARIDVLMQQHATTPYIGCFLTDGDPEALMRDAKLLDASLDAAVAQAAQRGAQAVIIGGGPLGEAAERLTPPLGVTLISPIREAAKAMQIALTTR
ncbi:aspartate/glutamate racemase family protein [Sagittula sp. SSi028]|uniref:aspartate/glutamate racemase family protein n=1 Tax=Sagittula sp. SSi028 TaxID=3400636 RepID=UPI003AF62A2E